MSGQRSEPGKGEQIGCYLVDLERLGWHGPDAGLQGGLNEDFADCHWPVVVKAKLDVSADQLVRSLRVLADSIESGDFYMHPESWGCGFD